jgi:hypothetical protein
MMTTTTTGVTRQLASSLADLRFEDLPKEVVARTEERACCRSSKPPPVSGRPVPWPKQIEAVNRGIVPSETEISLARRVLEAAEATGAVRFEREMVDRPVIERARGILARTSG